MTGLYSGPDGECSDKVGNVFITIQGEKIVEYAHGGTKPIATLNDPGYYPNACSVDPTTGDLAVANVSGPTKHRGSLAVYKHARGAPKFFVDPDYEFQTYYFCGYDPMGNVFVDGGDPSYGHRRRKQNVSL